MLHYIRGPILLLLDNIALESGPGIKWSPEEFCDEMKSKEHLNGTLPFPGSPPLGLRAHHFFQSRALVLLFHSPIMNQ